MYSQFFRGHSSRVPRLLHMPHSVGRRYIGMARMPASRNTFSKPPNSQTKAFYVASCTPGPLL